MKDKITTLRTGYMSNDELAQWFNISLKSFTNRKKEKLKELENFCAFENIRGGVNILEIYNNVYSKNGSKAYNFIKDHVDEIWNDNGLDSCSRVGEEIIDKYSQELAISKSTIYNYTRQSRNYLYGKPFGERGILGSCIYIWCKKNGEGKDVKYEFFTPEEERIKEDLMKVYFGNVNEKQLVVQQMIDVGEIDKSEAWDYLSEITHMSKGNYALFLRDLANKIGCDNIVRGTLVERNALFTIENANGELETHKLEISSQPPQPHALSETKENCPSL